MELSFKVVWAAFFGICVFWGLIRYLVRRIREHRGRKAEGVQEFPVQKMSWRFYNTIHWQRKEIRSFKESYQYATNRIGPEEPGPDLDRNYSTVIAHLESANSRFNKALAFSLVITLYSLSFSVQWAIGCGAAFLLAPFFLVSMLEEGRNRLYSGVGYMYRHDHEMWFISAIERKAVSRDLFESAVWAISWSLFIAMVFWGMGKEY